MFNDASTNTREDIRTGVILMPLCGIAELLTHILPVSSCTLQRCQVGQIGPKLDKFGTFQIRFQYILARHSKEGQIGLKWD